MSAQPEHREENERWEGMSVRPRTKRCAEIIYNICNLQAHMLGKASNCLMRRKQPEHVGCEEVITVRLLPQGRFTAVWGRVGNNSNDVSAIHGEWQAARRCA